MAFEVVRQARLQPIQAVAKLQLDQRVIDVSNWAPALALIAALHAMPANAGEDDLINAAGAGDIAKIESLLAEKVNVNGRTKDVGMSALMFAAINGQIEAMQRLIAAHADVNIRARKGVTALMLAAQQGHLQAVQLLLAAHADAKAATEGGMTARMFAERGGYEDIAKILRVSEMQ
jgi:ankyrin repeat protein